MQHNEPEKRIGNYLLDGSHTSDREYLHQIPNCDVKERRNSCSASNATLSAASSSEILHHLQRLCQRQRHRSEERSFVRDIEKILVLLKNERGFQSEEFIAGSINEEASVEPPHDRESIKSNSSSSRGMPSVAEISLLFECISDLFDHRNHEVRNLAFEVIDLCMGYYGDKLGNTLRRKFFTRLEHYSAGDYQQRQSALRLLTQDGRNVEPFSVELGWLLLQLLEESDDQVDLVDLIQSILRRSPLSLDFETVIAITDIICGRCDAAWARGDVESCKRCLSFFHVVATHKLEHAASTSSSLRTLCCMVNADGHVTWSIMKHLLNGRAGFQVLRGLIHLLENPQTNSQWVLRGAVFFVGMSCWGSQRITKLDIGWAAILLALESVLECHDGVVIFEVILSIQRLIKKYGETMNVEWDIILQIFAKLSPWLAVNEEKEQERIEYLEHVNRSPSAREVYLLDAGMPGANNFLVGTVASTEQFSHTTDGNDGGISSDPFDVSIQQTRIPKELLDTLAVVEELVAHEKFNGEVEHFFHVTELYLPYLAESSVLFLLKYRAQETNPAYSIGWLRSLGNLLDLFFLNTSIMTPGIREEALEVLRVSLWSCRNVCEDRVIDEVLLPKLEKVYDDIHPQIRKKGLDLLIEVARQLESIRFDALLDVLSNAVTFSIYDDSQAFAAYGIVSLFSSYFNHLPSTRALRMYEIMTVLVETHRNPEVRKIALTCLLHICEANTEFHLQWRDNQVRTSRFLYCSHQAIQNHQTGACVPVSGAIRAMLTLISTESNAHIFRLAVKGIRKMLENRIILTDVDVGDVTSKVVSCIEYRAFGRAAIDDEVENLMNECLEESEGSADRKIDTTSGSKKSHEKLRAQCVTEGDALALSAAAATSGNLSPGSQHPRCLVVATALCKLRFLTYGLEILDVLITYSEQLSFAARHQVIMCLAGVMEMTPTVTEKDLASCNSAYESSQDATTLTPGGEGNLRKAASLPGGKAERSRHLIGPRLSLQPPPPTSHVTSMNHSGHQSEKAVSPHFGFTSRVLARLQSTARTPQTNLFNALSLSTASGNKVDTASNVSACNSRTFIMEMKLVKALYQAEFNALHTVGKSISLLGLSMSQEITNRLDVFLRAARLCFLTGEGELRADIFVVILEMLTNLVCSSKFDAALHQLKQIVEILLIGFEEEIVYEASFCRTQIRYQSFRLLCHCIFKCPRASADQRIVLAMIAMPTLKKHFHRTQSLLIESAIDFLMCFAFSKSWTTPSSLYTPKWVLNDEIDIENGEYELHPEEDKENEKPRNATNNSTLAIRANTWVHNNSILTIRINPDGIAKLTIRRASCTNSWRLHLFNRFVEDLRTNATLLAGGPAASSPRQKESEEITESLRKCSLDYADPTRTSSAPSTPAASDLHRIPPSPIKNKSFSLHTRSIGDDESSSFEGTPPTRVVRSASIGSAPKPKGKHEVLFRRGIGARSSSTGKKGGVRVPATFQHNPSVSLPPLPAYDGVGGSPSYFCESSELNQPSKFELGSNHGERFEKAGDLRISTCNGETERDHSTVPLNRRVPETHQNTSLTQNHQPNPHGYSLSKAQSDRVDKENTDEFMMDPSFLMMQLFDLTLDNRPRLVENGQALSRAIKVLDRTPEFETHKIGLLYVRNGNQKSELDILSNIGGSMQYVSFLRRLGTITMLKGYTGYTGGLDTTTDSDGQFGLVYKDECTQIMFHVATMMSSSEPKQIYAATSDSSTPSSNDSENVDASAKLTQKKRHIGNDFVHIIYKESDEEYNTNTFSGQFNDVHIIIQPLNDHEYRTQVKCKPGIRPFGPLFGIQIVSSDVISECVRLTSLNANIACRAFHQELVGFNTNSEERLKQIKQIGIRLTKPDEFDF